MKVKLTRGMIFDGPKNAGDIIDVPERMANEIIANGKGILFVSPAAGDKTPADQAGEKDQEKETPADDAVETQKPKRKGRKK